MVREEQTIITVAVQPNASRNQVTGIEDGICHLRIAAPPVKGKANRELINFLSGILRISPSRLNIVKGMTSRRKTISIRGLTESQIIEQFEKLCQQP
ncbi:MAG: DUF167 domain-containing protein [Dehalococcoidales bacterium]|nr:DUF167 domain-containing protein [Dehalococcoidales bacterium]